MYRSDTFVVRNAIEQCIEWLSSFNLSFIVFKKAFDSIHRGALWKVLALYGIPCKINQKTQA